MIINHSTMGLSIRIPSDSKRWKMIELNHGWHMGHTFCQHESVPYNVVILSHIRRFLLYIDGSIQDYS